MAKHTQSINKQKVRDEKRKKERKEIKGHRQPKLRTPWKKKKQVNE